MLFTGYTIAKKRSHEIAAKDNTELAISPNDAALKNLQMNFPQGPLIESVCPKMPVMNEGVAITV